MTGTVRNDPTNAPRRFVLRLWQAEHAFGDTMRDITREAFRDRTGIEIGFCFPVGGSATVSARTLDEPPWSGNGYRARRCATVVVTR